VHLGARLIAGAASLLIWGGANAADPVPSNPDGRPLADPHYGNVLFEYFQGHYFDAATDLMAARAQGRASEYQDEGDVLLGGMMLSLGQVEDASALFHRVLSQSQTPAVRDRAWLELARIAYQRDQLDVASQSLDHIDDQLPKQYVADFKMLQVQVLLDQSRIQKAIGILQNWPDDTTGMWKQVAQFNLASALAKAGRKDEAFMALEKLGTLDAQDDEQQALRDRANVALGYLLLEDQKAAKAREILARVSMDGPFSNKALLGMGWADIETKRYTESMAVWNELQKRDPMDPAVLEASLAAPYSLSMLGLQGQAASRYEASIAGYASETANLNAMIGKIQSGDLLANLQNAEATDLPAWKQPPSLPSESTPETRFLRHLLASNQFQAALKLYREQRMYKENLDQWQARLTALKSATQAKATSNNMGVLTMQNRISALDARVSGMPDSTRKQNLAQDLTQARTDLNQAVAGARQLNSAQNVMQIDQAQARTQELMTRVDQQMASLAAMMNQMAVAELNTEKDRLEHYRMEAGFALARVYDRAAKQQQERQQEQLQQQRQQQGAAAPDGQNEPAPADIQQKSVPQGEGKPQ